MEPNSTCSTKEKDKRDQANPTTYYRVVKFGVGFGLVGILLLLYLISIGLCQATVYWFGLWMDNLRKVFKLMLWTRPLISWVPISDWLKHQFGNCEKGTKSKTTEIWIDKLFSLEWQSVLLYGFCFKFRSNRLIYNFTRRTLRLFRTVLKFLCRWHNIRIVTNMMTI